MNLMFWKSKTTAQSSADESRDEPDDSDASLKSPGLETRNKVTSEDTLGEAAGGNPAHPNKRLVLGAIIGLPILAVIGFATWKIFLPTLNSYLAAGSSPKSSQPLPLPEKQLIKLPTIEFLQSRKAQSKDQQTGIGALKNKNSQLHTQIEALKTAPQHVENPLSANQQAEIENLKNDNDELKTQISTLKAELPQLEKTQAERHKANIDALTKKNNTLQAQIEALKKSQRQRPSTSPASRPTIKVQPSPRSNDIAIGNASPKDTAMTLKEVIDAMNAK